MTFRQFCYDLILPERDFHRQTAGEGNRTLVSSLGSWRSTIELHPQNEEVKVMVKRE
jgi:hypothetical protein